jgi:N-acetylmuramoyl-L-alanine amidase
MDFPRGVVRSIQPIRRSGGVEVLLICEPPQAKVRTLTLSDPDRLVVDVMLPGPMADGRAVAQGSPAPSVPSGAGTTSRAKSPPLGAPTPGPDTRSPSAGAPVSQPATNPGAPGKESVGGTAGSTPAEADREGPVAPLTVVLDPGHGGHDTGAVGPSGLMEKDVVLDLAFRLRRLLQDRLGVRVLMTRTEDVFVSLQDRSAFVNRAKADFLVSLHVNAANTRGAIGFETFYFTREPSDNDARASAQRENLVIENNGTTGKDLESLLRTTLADMAVTRDMKESSNLAERILASLEKILRVENRGVKSGPFYVLATAAMPAVLVESAFITNPREERKLQREEYRQRIAQALFEGIAAYKVRYEQRQGLRSTPAGLRS